MIDFQKIRIGDILQVVNETEESGDYYQVYEVGSDYCLGENRFCEKRRFERAEDAKFLDWLMNVSDIARI